MDRETIINLPKKILKFVIAAKVINKTSKLVRRIYLFIPKFDKITGIDTDKLVQNHISK
ncbi:MAG: hypothetical protein IJN88_04555 [Clostridia bacterium]|nr:hypothetical protein [Clostridia bacterium]